MTEPATATCPECRGSGVQGGTGSYYDVPGKRKPCGSCDDPKPAAAALPTPGPCTPPCWTEMRCERCGRIEAPRGRTIGLEAAAAYCSCPDVRGCGYAHTARHLWDEHDPERWRFDPEGEKAHVAECERCRPDAD